MIGPYRGGRTVGLAGIADQPNVFYIGVNNGGVWKTDDSGCTWRPIFDEQPTGSIGAVAVAPSDPNVVYVGSGEGLQRPDLSVGDGMYKSTDARQDVAAPGAARRAADSRRLSWTRGNRRTGCSWPCWGILTGRTRSAACIARPTAARRFRRCCTRTTGPAPSTWPSIRAIRRRSTRCCGRRSRVRGRTGRFPARTAGCSNPPTAATNWTPLTGGLPTFAQGAGPHRHRDGAERAESHVCAGGSARAERRAVPLRRCRRHLEAREQRAAHLRARIGFRVRARRPHEQRRDLRRQHLDLPFRPTRGETFTAIKGAPGGDDYHTIWINPKNPDIILLALDQGATISVNHGRTWSSWYNQPTAQFYHVITDNQFPYWVYGGQQESGSAGVASRGNDGEITFRDWHPVGAAEYAYVAPDPLNARYRVRRRHAGRGRGDALGPRHRRGGASGHAGAAPAHVSGAVFVQGSARTVRRECSP